MNGVRRLPPVEQFAHQAGLAHPARTDNRDGPVVEQGASDLGEFAGAADEPIRWGVPPTSRRRRRGSRHLLPVGEDDPFEFAERRARVESRLVDDPATHAGQGPQRLGPATGAMQCPREHEVERLVGRLGGGCGAEVGEQCRGLAGVEACREPITTELASPRRQPRQFGRERQRIGDVGERFAAPHGQRLAEERRGARRVGAAL